MSELLKERVLLVLALILCVAVSLLGAWDAPELSPVGIIYSSTTGLSGAVSSYDTADITVSSADTAVSTATTSKEIQKTKETQETKEKTEYSHTQIVNINTADQKQLEALPGIGQVIAARIIEYRETHGGFDTIEEIKNVSGIGEKRFADIQNLITVD